MMMVTVLVVVVVVMEDGADDNNCSTSGNSDKDGNDYSHDNIEHIGIYWYNIDTFAVVFDVTVDVIVAPFP